MGSKVIYGIYNEETHARFLITCFIFFCLTLVCCCNRLRYPEDSHPAGTLEEACPYLCQGCDYRYDKSFKTCTCKGSYMADGYTMLCSSSK